MPLAIEGRAGLGSPPSFSSAQRGHYDFAEVVRAACRFLDELEGDLRVRRRDRSACRRRITETFTNVDNGNFVVSTVNLIDKDL
jgi:hypothetical protein